MPEQPKTEFDEPTVLNQIDRLLASVNRAEVDDTLISDTVSLLRGHIEDGMIREVTHALENFDFEKAIRELRRIGKCVKKKENKSVE